VAWGKVFGNGMSASGVGMVVGVGWGLQMGRNPYFRLRLAREWCMRESPGGLYSLQTSDHGIRYVDQPAAH